MKCNREPREYDGKIQHLFRLYLETRKSYFNVPVLFKKVFDKYDIIDTLVYNRNRILFLLILTLELLRLLLVSIYPISIKLNL